MKIVVIKIISYVQNNESITWVMEDTVAVLQYCSIVYTDISAFILKL